MFWLGLLLAVCYVPGYTGASIPTQWAVLSVLLPLSLWSGSATLGHKLFFVFGLLACFSTLWALNPFTSVWGLWFVFIWGLSYHLGTTVSDLRGLWQGLAVGLIPSAHIAGLQMVGESPVLVQDINHPAGLFFNSSLLGMVCGLVIVGLVCHRLWWYIPAPAFALLFSGSRGGIVMVAVGLAARFGGALAAIALVAAGMLLFIFTVDPADMQRMQIWGVTLRTIDILGFGPGSFLDLFYIDKIKGAMIHPEYVHNDILQLTYEYGLGAISLIGLFGMALRKSTHLDWPVLVAFATAAGFYFPLYAPVTAFIGFVVAGSCLCNRVVVRHHSPDWRFGFLPWYPPQRSVSDPDGGQAIPLVARTKAKG